MPVECSSDVDDPQRGRKFPGVQVPVAQGHWVRHGGQRPAAGPKFREQGAHGRAFCGTEAIGMPKTECSIIGQESTAQLGKRLQSAVGHPQGKPARCLKT
jgi:hypothetical protein